MSSPVIRPVPSQTDNKILYFAYGSNMDPKQMAHRRMAGAHTLWPDKDVEVLEENPLGVAFLENYSLNFDKKSSGQPGACFASIAPKVNSRVEGVLYELDSKFIEILDYYEGVSKGHYTKEMVEVVLKTDTAQKKISALAYIAHPNASIPKGTVGTPTITYLNTILSGAHRWELFDTIAFIKDWPTYKTSGQPT